MKSLSFIFLSFFINLLSLQAHDIFNLNKCQTSDVECSFYQCAEEKFQCGENGYFKDVAEKLCRPTSYKKHKQPMLTKFTQDVRKCLQEKVKVIASEVVNCEEMESKALDSHIPCFVESGFCELNFFERLLIFRNPFGFIKIAGIKKMTSLSNDLFSTCHRKKLGRE